MGRKEDDNEFMKYLPSTLGGAVGDSVGSLAGALGGASLGAVLAKSKSLDPKKILAGALMGAVPGSFLGRAAGASGGSAAFAPDGEGKKQALGTGLGSLGGAAAAGGGTLALIAALKGNPRLLAKLGGSAGARMKNAIAAGGIGSIIGGATGSSLAQERKR